MASVWQDRADLTDVIEEFPSEFDRLRVASYATNRLLRHDHHDDVFPRVQAALDASSDTAARERWAGLTYVPANVLGILSKASAEDLFLDPPRITFGDDNAANAAGEAWGSVADRSGWHGLLLDEIDGASVNGDAALKLYAKDGQPVVDAVDVSIVFRGEDYFPEYAAAQRDRRITRFPFVASPVKVGDDWFVLLEVHEPGRVVYRAYRWAVSCPPERTPSFADEGALTYEVPTETLGVDVQDYETGLADPTLIIVHNDRGEHAFWGSSDYTRGATGLQDAINWQLSTLLSHGERLVAGGITVLPQEMMADVIGMDAGGSAGSKDYGRRSLTGGSVPALTRRKLDVVFEHGQNAGLTRYVEENPKYEGAMKLLEGLWSAFERIANVTLDPLFVQTKAPESGRAMRLSRYRDQRRIARKQVRWSPAIRQIPQMCLAMLGMDVAQPSIAWADSVKLSDQERAEVINSRVAGKATLSVEGALERYDGMTPDQAAAEAKRIDEDGAMARVSSPALFSETQQFTDETERPPGETPEGGA